MSTASPPRYLRDCMESTAPQVASTACVDSDCFIYVCQPFPSSFNFLRGARACGAQFKSRRGFGEEEHLHSQRGRRFLKGCLSLLLTRLTLQLMFVFQISVQLTKVLLHMENKYNISDFLRLRQATMVALTVTDCIPVWTHQTLFSSPRGIITISNLFILINPLLRFLIGDSVSNCGVLLFELQPSPAARYLGGERHHVPPADTFNDLT